MHAVHKIILQVFAAPEENAEAVKQGLLALIPFSLEDARIQVQDKKATGFNERTLHIYTIELQRESDTNQFLGWLMGKLGPEQKDQLWRQRESRLDEELKFYIRLDKDAWLEKRLVITDFGNCYHLTFNIAAYPATREKAMRIIETILKQ